MKNTELVLKKIWLDGEHAEKDVYVDFLSDFSAAPDKKALLFITCDSMYTVRINGKLAGFGQCSDYPWHKYYDEVDITAFLEKKNRMEITVWFTGYDCLTYITGEPMLAFKAMQGEKVLAESGEEVLSRLNVNYRNGYCKTITTQMGYGFYYDISENNNLPYKNSRVTGEVTAFARDIEGLTLQPRAKAEISRTDYGYFIDLGAETVGFLDVDFISPCEQNILVAYGEHAENGNVARIIAYRDFSVELKAREGENKYLNTFRRLACRYLQVFTEQPVKVNYLGIRPVTRPVKEVKRTFKDPLAERIYNVSVNTLKACMHEHYEDCPWREQALYNMDSRNQMLCGYYAFEGYDFQKFNLLLMTQGLWHESGVLSMCFPSRFDKYIPFFSLVYVLQVYEYIKHSGDREILDLAGSTLKKITENFYARIESNGLIANFPPPLWNFYEWSPSNYGVFDAKCADKKIYDLILNCMFIYVCGLYDELFGTKHDLSFMREAVKATFFDEKKGLFKSSTEGVSYTQLGNSMAVIAGIGGEEIIDSIINDKEIEKISLSMNTFLYEAMLKYGDKYKEFILKDIEKKYKPMLDAGATTFWETEKGYKDFGGAGSLCHGWSAMPVYYYSVLGAAEK